MISWFSAVALLVAQDARELVEKLHSDRIEQREEAVRSLRRLAEAPPELEKAAQDPDPEVAAQARSVLRFFEIRRRLSTRLRAAVPGIEERLAAGGWMQALLEASDPERRKGPLEREDLEVLAGPALRQARTEDEREEVVNVLTSRRLRTAIPELLALLQAAHEDTRLLASRALTVLDAREAVKEVADLLGHGRPEVRLSALDLLVDLRARQSVDRVAALLGDPNPDVRGQAVSALYDFRAHEHRGAIRKLLADPHPKVRSRAAWTLWQLNDPDLVSGVVPLLKDEASSVRRDAVYILGGELGPKAAPLLMGLLDDTDDDVRLTALERLARHEETLPTDRLQSLLKDKNEKVRSEALSLLVERKDPIALPKVRALLQDEKPDTRLVGLHFLRRLKPENGDAEARALLQDPVPAVRARAAAELPELVGAGAVPVLLNLLQDESSEVVLAAARALTGLKSKEAVTPFLGLLEKQRAELDADILALLAQIQGPDAVPILLQGLESGSEAIRDRSVSQLRATGVRLHLPAVKALLRSPRAEVRRTALQALDWLPGKDRVPLAAELIGDPDAVVQEMAVSIVLERGDASYAARIRPFLAVPSLRADAARALARWKDREAVTGIRALLKDADSEVRHAAIESLLVLGAKESAPDLRPFLDAEEPSIRGIALIALEAFEARIEHPERLDFERFDPVPWSRSFVTGEAGLTQLKVLRALHRMGSPLGLRELIRHVCWTGQSPAGEGERILREIGVEKALPALRTMLSDPDPSERMTAIDALGILTGRAHAEEIVRGLSDPHEQVRGVAIEVLTEIGARDAVPEIARRLDDRYESVRSVAASALGRLGAKASAPELRRRLKDADATVKQAAAEALGRLGSVESVPDLLTLLDGDGTTRAVAARVLGELGAAQAIGRLREILRDDEDLEAREAAAGALARLDVRPAGAEIAKALEDVETKRSLSFQCGGVRRQERTPAPWRGEGEGPHPFNAVRCPELWERLRKTPLPEDLEGTRRELARALGERAGVAVELPGSEEEDERPWRNRILSRGGERSLLDALDSLTSDSYCLVLEPDRIRILPYPEGLTAWKEWWKARASR